MGSKGSSSKRKSSKKKSNKISSQMLKKKSRRKESKKRSHPDSVSLNSKYTSSTSESDYGSRKKKSKKLRRDYSVPSYSDDSMSPASDSMPTHDKSYKRRKSQHRSPIALKSRKKRARKALDSPNNKAGSRKRKRLSRDLSVKSRKKSLKKKSKKHLTTSSSSDSESTCHRRSSSSTAEGECQRNKVMLNKEIERLRGWESHKTHRKRKRSPSCSSCSRSSHHGISVGHSDGALAALNNSRRLKSVIAIADQPHDERENRWEKDPHKEEIVYDHDDYPSPKSLDSNEGGCKKESDNQSHGASNKRICVENVECEEVTEPAKSGNNGSDRYNACDSQSDVVHTNDFDNEKETGVSVTVAALDGDGDRDGVGFDLESILRQKALENLRRFQGGLQAGRRTTSNIDIMNENGNESSTRRVDILQNQSTKLDSNSVWEMDQKSKPTLKRDFSQLMEVRSNPDGEHVEKESGIAKQIATHPPNEAAILAYTKKEKFATTPAVFAKPVSISDTNQGIGFTNACNSSATEPISCVHPISGEHSLKDQQNEAKNGSEFEQKTMSVMRGGEMVQVSYKVYIPKRAPALARRQLKR